MECTECKPKQLEFQGLGRRRVVADFDGGAISSDGGALLLREVEVARGIIKGFAECFDDCRDQRFIEHTLLELVAQRVYAIALGYEDLNDHQELRRDPVLATLVEKSDPTGGDRRRERDRGCPLAGKSTLNRLELTPMDGTDKSRYHKIVCRPEAVDRLFVDLFLDSFTTPPDEIVLDVDATDDPLHGKQEGRFFHGYYRHYCYLPLYIFCGAFLLCARLRPSNQDASGGCVEELARLVAQIRARWPGVRIVIRGDGDFARERILAWCEAHKVDYVIGLPKNPRLLNRIGKQMEHARRKYHRTGRPARCFRNFRYRTLKSWSRSRRVVGKAEHLGRGPNPRFVVTSLSGDRCRGRDLYEKTYCARGDMENRIKEQQLSLFADRTSTSVFAANQLRLWFSSVAYILVNELRRVGLKGTALARAQCHTIRLKLLKIGALVSVTFRRIRLRLASGYPFADLFRTVMRNLTRRYAFSTA
jgi:hypothetical protein